MSDRLVLGYHSVSASTRSRQTVTREALRRQVSMLLGQGYRATTFARAVLDPGSERVFAVTFDDGEQNVLEHGYPVLGELGVPATVFVAVGTVGTAGVLGWDELALLAGEGWEIGSHTITHALLPELDDGALEHEVRGSREELEGALGLPCRSIAYPYGAFDARVRAAVAAAGYSAGCTLESARPSDPLAWPRVGVDGNDGRLLFRLKTSRHGRRLRRTPLRGPLDRAGRAARALVTR